MLEFADGNKEVDVDNTGVGLIDFGWGTPLHRYSDVVFTCIQYLSKSKQPGNVSDVFSSHENVRQSKRCSNTGCLLE